MLVPSELSAISKKLSATFTTREAVQMATEELRDTLIQLYGDNTEAARIFAMGMILARVNRMKSA